MKDRVLCSVSTYVHHSVTRGCLEVYAISRRDYFWIECSAIGKQTIICITLELFGIDGLVWTRHCRYEVGNEWGRRSP
jgi:hypothetical protein